MHYLRNQGFGNNPGPMQIFEKVLCSKLKFQRLLVIYVRQYSRGVRNSIYSSFPTAFAIPTWNKEYHDTFYTLCRGALLYPQTSLAILLNSTLPLVWGQLPSFTKSCRALSNTIKSALCNKHGLRHISSYQPIPRHYDRYPVVHALQDREITASQPIAIPSENATRYIVWR